MIITYSNPSCPSKSPNLRCFTYTPRSCYGIPKLFPPSHTTLPLKYDYNLQDQTHNHYQFQPFIYLPTFAVLPILHDHSTESVAIPTLTRLPLTQLRLLFSGIIRCFNPPSYSPNICSLTHTLRLY